MAIWGPTVTLVTVVSLLFSMKASCWGWSSLHLIDQHSFFSNSSTLPPCAFISRMLRTPVISTKPSLVPSQFIPIRTGRGFQNNLAYSVMCGSVNLLRAPDSLPMMSNCSLTAMPQMGSSDYLVLSKVSLSYIPLRSGFSSTNQQTSLPIFLYPDWVEG